MSGHAVLSWCCSSCTLISGGGSIQTAVTRLQWTFQTMRSQAPVAVDSGSTVRCNIYTRPVRPETRECMNDIILHGPQLSIGWVDPWVGLGWVHYSKGTKHSKDYVNAFKVRLDKIPLHQAVKLLVVLGWVQIFPLVAGWVGSVS